MILMNDFAAEPEAIRLASLKAAERVLRSGWYVLGPEVEAFERRWAEECRIPHAVGVGNGMDAIEIILRALEIGPGDEVITTPMTAFATVLAVLRVGAVPVLADVDPATGLMSVESAERCVSKRTRAVLLVHLYGQVRQMEKWSVLCSNFSIALIEDCAQAHLAREGGCTAGAFGVAGAYSFYPTKNLGAIGDGGAVVTRDEALADRARQLRNYGQSRRYHHPLLGLNSRLDELQAALLSARLSWLRSFTERRQQIAERYFEEISTPRVEPLARPLTQESHAYHLFVVKAERREALQAHLHTSGVQSLIHYPIPVHQQPPCLDLARDPQGLSAAEGHAATCLSLPCHPQMSDDAVQRVIDAVNGFR